MKESPMWSKYETGDEFEPQLAFAQFLQEAKTHVCQENFKAASLEETGQKQLRGRKKSWKSLFSWLKADKKDSKTIIDEQELQLKSSYNKSKTKRSYSSGPINGIKGCSGGRPRRPMSGPLYGLFHHTKRIEKEFQTPYITLGQLNNPHSLPSYGPLYLVT